MGRVAYVNGRFVPHRDAVVHIEDRGYQLADAVYEVWSMFGGKLADAEGHFDGGRGIVAQTEGAAL